MTTRKQPPKTPPRTPKAENNDSRTAKTRAPWSVNGQNEKKINDRKE